MNPDPDPEVPWIRIQSWYETLLKNQVVFTNVQKMVTTGNIA